MAGPEYRTRAYREAKRTMRGAPCWMCGARSTTVDHYPPISTFPPGQWVGVLRPACAPCQAGQGGLRRGSTERRPPLPSRSW